MNFVNLILSILWQWWNKTYWYLNFSNFEINLHKSHDSLPSSCNMTSYCGKYLFLVRDFQFCLGNQVILCWFLTWFCFKVWLEIKWPDLLTAARLLLLWRASLLRDHFYITLGSWYNKAYDLFMFSDTIRYLSLHDNKYIRYFPGHTKR